MTPYRDLFEISKILLSAEDSIAAARTLLHRIVERTDAERAFLVVSDGDGSFREAFSVRYDQATLAPEERRFSRTLVREVLAGSGSIHVPNLIEDPRVSAAASARILGRCSVLVAPLLAGEEVYGAVYLDAPGRVGAFGPDQRSFLDEFTGVAGLFLRRAAEREALTRRVRTLERDLFARYDFQGIVASHPRMAELLETVAQVAGSEATVLVTGETGTGKELVARAIHANSERRGGPFVTVHCAALPGTLLEGELFGHEAGAFTDARRPRRGRLAAAGGGTLFLDEVGEIPPELQAKLLRFLQSGEIQRLGSDRTERVDVRVVAATHRDLPALVASGRFREDLWYRLRVVELDVPPLRERRSDVPLLFDHFLARHWRLGPPAPRLDEAARRAIEAHDYPGNVRELAHLAERMAVLARGPELGVELLPPEVARAAPAPSGEPEASVPLTNDGLKTARQEAVTRVETRFLDRLLEAAEGNVSRAARMAGMRRSYLQKLLARHRGEASPSGGGENQA